MQFVKMHGAANDYVVLDSFRMPPPSDLATLARTLCDRHRGIGADGLLVVGPPISSSDAGARMRILNSDGSEAEMCGNGLRCAARFLREEGHVAADEFGVETGRGVLDVECHRVGGRIDSITLDMGEPILEPHAIPTTLSGSPPLASSILVDGRDIAVCAVSMGNPHAVVFVNDIDDELVHGLGPQIEHYAAFPNRTNVEFVRVDDRRTLTVRVWERGAGETLACGTGACAVVVAAVLSGLVEDRVTVRLPGGDLAIDWTGRRGVRLTGPAVEVFRGTWEPNASQLPCLRAG